MMERITIDEAPFFERFLGFKFTLELAKDAEKTTRNIRSLMEIFDSFCLLEESD